MSQSSYSEKLQDPRWQKKRLEILERDNWSCRVCHNTHNTLHVHHLGYDDCEPWEVSDRLLMTLCDLCHEDEGPDFRRIEKILVRSVRLLGLTNAQVERIASAFLVNERQLTEPEADELAALIRGWSKSVRDNNGAR